MNNETTIVQSKPKTSGKKRAKKAVAFLLVVAILITSAYAFLTAHQTKTNVFTVGNIRLELHEDGWEANSALVNKQYDGTTYENGTQYISSSKLENIIPGEPITKDPMIKNVGKNPAYVYISVAMPQVNNEDMFDVNGLSGNWELFKTVDQSGYKVNYYYYNGQLAAGSDTDNLFQSVTLKESVYPYLSENADYSIIINGYGAQTTNTDNWKTAWNRIREADTALPDYNEDMSLFATEQVAAGDPVEMKFDSSLAKQNFSFDWVTDEGEVAYEGMTMPQHSLRLNARYTQLTSEPVSEGIFHFFILKDENNNYYARVLGLNNFDNRSVINIPTEITFLYNEGQRQYTSGNDIIDIEWDLLSEFNINEQYTVPVLKSNDFWYEYESIKSITFPDSINEISGHYSDNIIDNHTENINVPYAIDSLTDNFFACMKNINQLVIPNHIQRVGYDVFKNSYINTLILSKAVGEWGFNGGGIGCFGNELIINADLNAYTLYLPSFKHYTFNGSTYVSSINMWQYSLEETEENQIIIPDKIIIEINNTLICDEDAYMGFMITHGYNRENKIQNFEYIINGYVNKLGTCSPEENTNYSLLGSGTVDTLYSSQWYPSYEDQGYDMTVHSFDTSAFTGTINNQETKYYG